MSHEKLKTNKQSVEKALNEVLEIDQLENDRTIPTKNFYELSKQ